MPFPLAGGGVERDDAGAVQIVSGVKTAVIVDRGSVSRDVDQIMLRIRRKRAPRESVVPVILTAMLTLAGN